MGQVTRARLLAGGALFLAGMWVVGWLLLGNRIEPGLLPASSGPAALSAARAIASYTSVPVEREVVGAVHSRVPVDVSSRVAALVRSVRVHAGDRVQRGEVVVTLDGADLRARLEQAKASVAGARAELTRTSADRARFEALYARGSVTAREHDAAEAAYQAARARWQEAQAAVAQAAAALGYVTVRSPVDGLVVRRMVEPGDMALPGKPLVMLYAHRELRVSLEVPEKWMAHLRVGTPVKVTVDAVGKTFATEVSEVVPAANPASRTVIVRAELPAGAGLRPGMFARARFSAGEERLLSVPAAAVETVGQLTVVRVYERGASELRQVSTGRQLPGGRIEILAGLRPGETVLLPRASALPLPQ